MYSEISLSAHSRPIVRISSNFDKKIIARITCKLTILKVDGLKSYIIEVKYTATRGAIVSLFLLNFQYFLKFE